MSKALRIFLAAAMVLAAVSCERRPLVSPSEAVKIAIRVDVKTVTNVNANVRSSIHLYGTNTSLWADKLDQLDPDMMRVLIYDPSTDKLLSQSFISSNELDSEGNKVFKGNLGISHGDYNFLVYNFDTPTTQVSYENNEMDILAFTDEVSPAQKSRLLNYHTKGDGQVENYFEDLKIHFEPEHLLVANEKNVRISPHDTLIVVETEASTVIDTYYLQIRVNGMQYASEATAVITGLSPSNRIGLNERTIDPTAAVVFNMQKGYDESIADTNKDVLCAVFNTFGKINTVSSDLHVTFNVIDTAGNLLQYDVNMDKVFNSELAIKYHWLIIEESVINIPDPGTNPNPDAGGGFQPRVDDWEEEQGEIAI